jgi:hypothetical protein
MDAIFNINYGAFARKHQCMCKPFFKSDITFESTLLLSSLLGFFFFGTKISFSKKKTLFCFLLEKTEKRKRRKKNGIEAVKRFSFAPRRFKMKILWSRPLRSSRSSECFVPSCRPERFAPLDFRLSGCFYARPSALLRSQPRSR